MGICLYGMLCLDPGQHVKFLAQGYVPSSRGQTGAGDATKRTEIRLWFGNLVPAVPSLLADDGFLRPAPSTFEGPVLSRPGRKVPTTLLVFHRFAWDYPTLSDTVYHIRSNKSVRLGTFRRRDFHSFCTSERLHSAAAFLQQLKKFADHLEARTRITPSPLGHPRGLRGRRSGHSECKTTPEAQDSSGFLHVAST